MSLSRINSCDNPYLTIETDIMQESDVDFRLESDTLKPTAGWTKSLVFTKEGIFPQKNPTDPFFRAVPSVENRQVSEEYRKNFAIVNAIPSNDFEVIKAHSVLSVTLDDLPGYEIVALANDRATGTRVLLYSVVLFKPGSYIKMHGWVGSDQSATYLKEFREIAQSFRQHP